MKPACQRGAAAQVDVREQLPHTFAPQAHLPTGDAMHHRIASRLALLALTVVVCLWARASWARGPVPRAVAPTRSSENPALAVQRYTLANGLEVLLHPDRSVPLCAVDVWYHVGSGDEGAGKSGFAHLFEHMMFQGAVHTGEDAHFDVLKKVGASSINGTTSTDRTNYYEVVPSHQLETALWLESDRMGFLLPLLTQKSLDNQREVVRNERRQNYDNVPYGKERFAIHALLYGEGHPYRYMTIGRHEDLEAATLADVRAFFETWYVPANATLALAGDFDVVEAKKLIDKWFGSFPSSRKPPRRSAEPTPVQGPQRQEVLDPFARLRMVHYAWHSPKFYAPGDAELDILAHALGHSGTGRLYRQLVLETQQAQSVSVYQDSQQLSSVFHVSAVLKPDADLAQVEKAIEEEMEHVMQAPLAQKERDRAVTAVEASFVWGLEDLLARAQKLQDYNHYLGRPESIDDDRARYRTATPQGIQAVAAQFFGKDKRVEVVTMPQPGRRGGVK